MERFKFEFEAKGMLLSIRADSEAEALRIISRTDPNAILLSRQELLGESHYLSILKSKFDTLKECLLEMESENSPELREMIRDEIAQIVKHGPETKKYILLALKDHLLHMETQKVE